MRDLKIWRVRYLLNNKFCYLGDPKKKSEAKKEYEQIINIYKNVPGSALRISLQRRDPKDVYAYKIVESFTI